jgi:RimJ/RimL family protein N-acetyltransferase
MSGGGLTYPMTLDDFKNKKTIALSNDPKNMKSYLVEYLGLPCGSIGYFRRENNSPLEIGYWLGKDYWGKGIAEKALLLLIDKIRNSNIDTLITATVLRDNQASHIILSRCGFRKEGESTIDSPARKMKVNVVHYSCNL